MKARLLWHEFRAGFLNASQFQQQGPLFLGKVRVEGGSIWLAHLSDGSAHPFEFVLPLLANQGDVQERFLVQPSAWPHRRVHDAFDEAFILPRD